MVLYGPYNDEVRYYLESLKSFEVHVCAILGSADYIRSRQKICVTLDIYTYSL